MTTENQLLRDAVFTVLEGFTIPHDVRKILETAYYAALTQPAQPAEGGEALDDADPLMALDECAKLLETRRLMGDGVRCEVAAKNARAAMRRLTAPPASQEQAQQPSGGEVVANERDCPHCNYTGTFHCGDVADKLKAGVCDPKDCSQAKVFGLRVATPKPEPMPEAVRVWAESPEPANLGSGWQEGYESARAWVRMQLSITKEQA